MQSEDAALYFGRNGERLAALHRRGRFVVCWPGLLFPQAWFLYRKMYGWAALVSAGPMLLGYVPHLAFLEWGTSLVGALGLKLYFAQADAAVARIRAADLPEDEARALLARAGGVSWIGACVGLAFVFSAFVLSLKVSHTLGFR